LQKEGQGNSLYRVIDDFIPKGVISIKNRKKSWVYGYDSQYDVVVISKSGEIGDIVEISDLKIALPKAPKKIFSRDSKPSNQYWERKE